MKYIAIKVKGLSYYLWFEAKEVVEEGSKFVGKKGWGKGGAYIDVFECNTDEIVSCISTEELGY